MSPPLRRQDEGMCVRSPLIRLLPAARPGNSAPFKDGEHKMTIHEGANMNGVKFVAVIIKFKTFADFKRR